MQIFEKLIMVAGYLKDIFVKRPTTFEVGDMVQLKDGTGFPMLVVEVHRLEKNNPMLYCRWYDTTTKETRFNLFLESNLAPFDWKKKM